MNPQLELAIRRLVAVAKKGHYEAHENFEQVGSVCMQVVPILDGTVNCHCWASGGMYQLGRMTKSYRGVRRAMRKLVGRVVYQLPLHAVAKLQ